MSSSSSSSGIGFGGLLCIVLIVLKLCHVINWSWIWILSPIWIGFIIAGITILTFWNYVHKHFDKTKTL